LTSKFFNVTAVKQSLARREAQCRLQQAAPLVCADTIRRAIKQASRFSGSDEVELHLDGFHVPASVA
jgi:hypothetical protein